MGKTSFIKIIESGSSRIFRIVLGGLWIFSFYHCGSVGSETDPLTITPSGLAETASDNHPTPLDPILPNHPLDEIPPPPDSNPTPAPTANPTAVPNLSPTPTPVPQASPTPIPQPPVGNLPTGGLFIEVASVAELTAAILSIPSNPTTAVTILMHAGTYENPIDRGDKIWINLNKNGKSPGEPITLMPYFDQNGVLDTVKISENTTHSPQGKLPLIVVSGNNVVVRDLEIDHWLGTGIEVSASDYFIIENLEVHNSHWDDAALEPFIKSTEKPGIYIRRANGGLIRHNRAHHNKVGIALGAKTNPYAEQVKNVVVERNLVYDNVTYKHLADDNSDGILTASSRNITLRNNVLWGNGDDGIDTYQSHQCKVLNNVSYNHRVCNLAVCGDGNGFKANTGGGGEHLYYGNISFNNKTNGFNHETDESQGIHTSYGNYGNWIFNNMAFDNGFRGLVTGTRTFQIQSPYEVMNNIIWNSGSVEYWHGHNDTSTTLNNSLTNSDYNIWGDCGYRIGGQTCANLTTNAEAHSILNITTDDLSFVGFDRNTDPSTLYVITDFNDPNFGRVPALEYKDANSLGVDMGVRTPFHCSNADDDFNFPMDPLADCIHWYGTNPDLGPYEFVP
jgi:parallel beta-helix repeat protein